MPDDVSVPFIVNGKGGIMGVKTGVGIVPARTLINDNVYPSIIVGRNGPIFFDVGEGLNPIGVDDQGRPLVDVDPRIGTGPHWSCAGGLDGAPGTRHIGPG